MNTHSVHAEARIAIDNNKFEIEKRRKIASLLAQSMTEWKLLELDANQSTLNRDIVQNHNVVEDIYRMNYYLDMKRSQSVHF